MQGVVARGEGAVAPRDCVGFQIVTKAHSVSSQRRRREVWGAAGVTKLTVPKDSDDN